MPSWTGDDPYDYEEYGDIPDRDDDSDAQPGECGRNIALGNARVGMQAGDLRVAGGLVINMPGHLGRGEERHEYTGPPSVQVQRGPRNVASGDDHIAFQLGGEDA